MIIVASVPHTGTHFVCQFLDFIGKGYNQDHLRGVATYDRDTLIIPMRDPASQFLSYRKRSRHARFEGLLNETVTWWNRLGEIVDKLIGQMVGLIIIVSLILPGIFRIKYFRRHIRAAGW